MTADVAAPVQAQLDAYNARDLEAFLACYADEVTLLAPDGVVVCEGIDALRQRSVQQFGSAWAPCLLAGRTVLGDWVVDDEYLMGESDSPARNVVAYHVRDGLIDRALSLS